jgi:hypothetical protein
MANPYREFTWQQLAEACNDKAGELLKVAEKAGSPKGDRAKDVAYLLLCVARSIELPQSLEHAGEFDATSFMAAIEERHDLAIRQARFRTLQLAVAMAHLPNPESWIFGAHVGNERVYDTAEGSDEGLMRMVEYLSHLPSARKGRRR